MNKSFYHFANFFLILTVAASVFHSTIHILLGPGFVSLASFKEWFLVAHIITLAGSLYLLKYYHHRQYRLAFLTATIAVLASLCHAAVFYAVLVSGALKNYYIPTFLISMGASTLYGISLIFSGAGKRLWLKAAGFSILIISLALGSAAIWGMYAQEAQVHATIQKIFQRVSLLGSLMPLLYILNFWRELRELEEEEKRALLQPSAQPAMTVMVVMSLCVTLVFGVLLATEAGSSLYWQRRNAEKTQALLSLADARTFAGSKGDTLQYLLLKPLDDHPDRQDSDPDKTYPLVVNLPYGGYEGAEVAQILSKDIYRKHYPAFIFIPYCPPGSGWGGIPDYPDIAPLVLEAIQALDQEFAIDADRRYVTGISRGGYGSWHFISLRPHMFAAAIPVCGEGNPAFAPAIKDVAVWAFHGEKDANVPVSGSRQMIEAMKQAGADPKYTEYKGEGHNIWHLVSETPGLLDWLFRQKRKD